MKNLNFFLSYALRLDSGEVDHSENEDISIKSPSEVEKPTRGRKRGAASNQEDKAPESKAKRGRKKANTSVEESEDQWGEDSNMLDSTMEMEDEQNSPPKRARRGRPPKSASNKDETPTKGRRGRRKAAPPPDEEEEENEAEPVAEGDDEVDDAGSENIEVKPKARRGRKPRFVPHAL